jgi:hypothetical protein
MNQRAGSRGAASLAPGYCISTLQREEPTRIHHPSRAARPGTPVREVVLTNYLPSTASHLAILIGLRRDSIPAYLIKRPFRLNTRSILLTQNQVLEC